MNYMEYIALSICSQLSTISQAKSGFIPLQPSSTVTNSQQMFFPQLCYSFKAMSSFFRGSFPVLLYVLARHVLCVISSPQNIDILLLWKQTWLFPCHISCNLEIRKGSKNRDWSNMIFIPFVHASSATSHSRRNQML